MRKIKRPMIFFLILTFGVTMFISSGISNAATSSDQPLRVLAEKMRSQGRDFYIGAAVPSNFSSSDQNIVKTEFDIVTCENDMKIGGISPSQGQFNYSGGDRIVSFAKQNNMIVHGHAFIWHKYNPGWVDGTKSMMESYINTVANHFKGSVYAWDVVNEAFQKDGTFRINAIGSNGQDGSSIFGQKQTKKYIEDAFIAANKADPKAKLVYNDYDLETREAKFDGVYAMVKDFKSRNIPIHGVGFQMHLGSTFTEQNAKDFAVKMQKLADLGVESYVTEMDVGCPDNTQSGLEKQAQIYSWIAKACVEQPYCRALQVWGVRDSQSWRINPEDPVDKAIAPLIFNDNGAKKPSYYAIQKAMSDYLNNTTTTTSKPTNTPAKNLGDVNFDGKINSTDVSLIERHTLGIVNLNDNAIAVADVNKDGKITSTDVSVVTRYVIGSISEL